MKDLSCNEGDIDGMNVVKVIQKDIDVTTVMNEDINRKRKKSCND